jgi:hypothetical protein
MHIAILSLLLGAMPDASADTKPVAAAPVIVVVCPEELRSAMTPWRERREAQQNRIEFVSNKGSAEEVRTRIREVAAGGRPRAILLVGDAPQANLKGAKALPQETPTFRLPAKVNIHWGGDPELASDNPYADFDGDQIPEVAIGRLPADSAAELSGMVRKILDYEDNDNFGPWRSRINFVAGEGGFGTVTDSVIESAARKFITWGVPAPYRTTMTYGSWQSPYCPDPHRFHECCLERLNEGCLFWVYIGHGSPQQVKQADFPDGRQPILSCADCQRLNCGETPPIAMFLACHTGSFASPKDCLAEELLRAPGGPVAVISGSNVTMPYAMSFLGREAMRECFENRRETVGELLFQAKRSIVTGYRSPFWSATNALTAAVSPISFQPKEERHEHLQLFNLFGDPTMKVRMPETVQITAPGKAVSGQTIHIAGQSPIDGDGEIELVVRRDRFRSKLPERTNYSTAPDARNAFEAAYQEANDPRLTTTKISVRNGRFEADLAVPIDASGPCHVRVFLSGADGFALGASDVSIQNENRSGR